MESASNESVQPPEPSAVSLVDEGGGASTGDDAREQSDVLMRELPSASGDQSALGSDLPAAEDHCAGTSPSNTGQDSASLEMKQPMECMELDERDDELTDEAEETRSFGFNLSNQSDLAGEAEKPPKKLAWTAISSSSSSSSTSSSSSSPRLASNWASRKRRQVNCIDSPGDSPTSRDNSKAATPSDGACGFASGSAEEPIIEPKEGTDPNETLEMKERRYYEKLGLVSTRRYFGGGGNEEEREDAGEGSSGLRRASGAEDDDDDDEEEEEDERRRNELFVSDSEDEESRNEWARRRPALFLRTRSDSDRHSNNDRNAQEVVTRRMRSEYKPANNRCSLLVPAPAVRVNGTSSPTSSTAGCGNSHASAPANGKIDHRQPSQVPSGVGPDCRSHRPPERCLLTLLRRREMGGRLGGRYGEVGWVNSGFTRHVRRSSHMLRRLRRRSVLNVHSGCVNALNFSPVDGNLIASGSDDQQIAITDWMREKMVTKFDSGHEMNVFQTRFLFESHNLLIASCARDGMVRLSQLNTSGDLVLSKLMFHHNDSCNKVAVHPHEPHSLISCGEDAVVVHMDIREPENENRYFQVYENRRSATVPLYSIHPHPHRSYEFCVCGRDPVIRVFDRRSISWGTVGARLSSSRSDLSQDYCEPLQRFCAFEELPRCQGREKMLWSAFESDQEAMDEEDLSESRRKREDEEEEEKEAELAMEDEEEDEEDEENSGSRVRRRKLAATAAADSPDGGSSGDGASKSGGSTRASSTAADATILVNLHVTSAVYSNSGDAILCSYNDADIFLFDTKAGREERPAHKYCGHRNNTTVKCVNFYGPDSEYIVSGSDCGNIFFWSRASEQIANFQPGDNLGVVNVLEPHPTLPVLATSGLDSDVKIWTPEWCDELEEVNPKRWPFEEKVLGRTVLENWMDRESAKTMLIGQSTLLRMLRIALQRTRNQQGPLAANAHPMSDDDDDDDDDDGDGGMDGGLGGGGGSSSGSDGEGRRRRRRDFCVQS